MKLLFISLLLQISSHSDFLETLYSRQDPLSLSKQISFYAQYPETKEGLRAKNQIARLLKIKELDHIAEPCLDLQILNELIKITFKTDKKTLELNQESLDFIDKISKDLKNRQIKGSQFVSTSELKVAAPSEIDVGRGLLLISLENEPDCNKKIRDYEAILDFMALCVKARIPENANHQDVVHAMNHFIFHELGYRFPAYSQHSEQIDTYTLLPSVLDNRQGVCLGVSLLYYSLAQRLDLPLDIYTPPGHIFLSLNTELNIETTARGIHIPLDRYLSLHVKELKKRDAKELLGFALFNQASVYLGKQNYKEASKLYEKVLEYIPSDEKTLELLGACYLMNGSIKEAGSTFLKLKNIQKSEITTHFLVDDYFKGYISPEALKVAFKEVDSCIDSLWKKVSDLEKVLKKSPKFQFAIEQLGVTYLQLHQYEKALAVFEKLYTLCPKNPVILYYLLNLSYNQYDRNKALMYKKSLEALIRELDYSPKAATDLIEEIDAIWPSINLLS